jgi:hypothetical protein
MAGKANPLNATVYRVIDLGTNTVVEDLIRDVDEAVARAGRELRRVPGGRFAVQVRIPPDEEWRALGTFGGFAG